MHVSSLLNVRMCLKRHLLTDPVLGHRSPLRVLDVGGADYNGSYRPMLVRIGADYTAVDISDGEGVDVVMGSPDHLPFDDGAFDFVICGQTFEHSARFWSLFAEMVRVCNDRGMILVSAPSEGVVHRYPVDYYRFFPDSLIALGEQHGLRVLEASTSPFGPFFDVLGVYAKSERLEPAVEPDPARWRALDDVVQNTAPDVLDPDVEEMRGAEPARDFLARAHRLLAPRNYLEIGVWRGFSLAKARCPAVGVDPFPEVTVDLKEHHSVMEMTAEDFFATQDVEAMVTPLDLVYIDGLHLIEHALTDFMNTERFSHRGTVIVVDDISPNHCAQASRSRTTRAWTGDVWKIQLILSVVRPDLLLVPINTHPTGSLMVIGADPTNRALWDDFDILMANEMIPRDPDDDVLCRRGSLEPNDRLLERVLRTVHAQRDRPEGPDVEALRSLVAGAQPRQLVRA